MDPSYKVISIGAFDAHPLWEERQAIRTAHATTTLIQSRDATILVDPSLPAQILAARLHERANISPEQVTHVFLTSFEPFRRRGLALFPAAQWLISEREREVVGVSMISQLREVREGGDAETTELLKSEVETLQRCAAAPDRIANGVDLFPLYGVTPGCCGLLLATVRATIVICGDAIASVEHLEQGKVLPTSADVEAARESFRDAVDIADLLILGRDNIVLNPLRQPM